MGRSCQNLVARWRAEGSAARCKGKRKEKAARCFYVFHTRGQGACAGRRHGTDQTIRQMRILRSFPRSGNPERSIWVPASAGTSGHGTCDWKIEMKMKTTTKKKETKTRPL